MHDSTHSCITRVVVTLNTSYSMDSVIHCALKESVKLYVHASIYCMYMHVLNVRNNVLQHHCVCITIYYH